MNVSLASHRYNKRLGQIKPSNDAGVPLVPDGPQFFRYGAIRLNAIEILEPLACAYFSNVFQLGLVHNKQELLQEMRARFTLRVYI